MGCWRITFETAPGSWVGEVLVKERRWTFR
jgi:hypothetical protein